MKNFYQYLASFAPDYSGAAAVFYDTGALIVICDPGGCSGNVCGYDEPRFYDNGGAVFSASLRDMDAIWGRDDRLVQKIVSAAAYGDFELIALIGTPVVSVIATDLEAVCHMVEKETGIRTVSVDTNGMDLYDIGQKKARRVLERNFPGKYVSGYTPLDSMPDDERVDGMIGEFAEKAGAGGIENKKALIIHQKDAAEKLRRRLLAEGCGEVVTGGWFRGCDIRFDDEEKFIEECMKYDVIFADPLYFRALEAFKGIRVDFPHLAVSGDLWI